jgi:hypothetical protein
MRQLLETGFEAESWRCYNAEDSHYNLTTVQALGVMSIREASCGRIRESLFLSTQSTQLAIEMQLHLQSAEPEDTDGDESEKAVRDATFWGAFSLNEYIMNACWVCPYKLIR